MGAPATLPLLFLPAWLGVSQVCSGLPRPAPTPTPRKQDLYRHPRAPQGSLGAATAPHFFSTQAHSHIFRFNNRADVRVVTIDGDPWFVAADVRNVLGASQAVSNWNLLDDDEVTTVPRGLASGKGMSRAKLLSESGLYKLVMHFGRP